MINLTDLEHKSYNMRGIYLNYMDASHNFAECIHFSLDFERMAPWKLTFKYICMYHRPRQRQDHTVATLNGIRMISSEQFVLFCYSFMYSQQINELKYK